MRRKLEQTLGVAAVGLGVAIGVREALAHSAAGQFLPLLWIDLAAAALLVAAGVSALRGGPAGGPLFGAFSLALGTSWIAFFQLALRALENRVPAPVTEALLPASLIAFASLAGALASGILAWRRPRH